MLSGPPMNPPTNRRSQNITDLKNLRRFGMGQLTAENENLAELTDFSLEHGLSKLKHLEVVSLYCSPEKMSDDAFEQLKANFPPTPYSSVFRLYIDDKVESEMSDSDSQDQSSP
ncbi:hypothetical protein Ocin01_16604 [Orchesella cincta]|uniref:Uncharacterized protein n=1 Tax=Orchesella cincta TaxID=48709 RepID=A0A1D2MAQ8_ORCCI|nr:hypothetical protein Ocin01_16604 [Orchesella cincta]